MTIDYQKLESKIPHFVYPILDELLKRGFKPTLVGGVVRDYLLNGELGTDWDIELFHETLFFEKGFWKELGKSFARFGKVVHLPYEVIRLEINSHHFEFSPPRIEHYQENVRNHSNFNAEFIFNLSFSDAVKRRDFTINAMGIRFHQNKRWEFLDPLDGLRHLRENILHCAGPDFAKDPVRFLRAYRFLDKFSFSFSPELKSLLSSMSLEGLTSSYVWSEMKKARDPVHFIFLLIKESQLKLPLDHDFLIKKNDVKKVLINPRSLESWVIALEWVGLSSEEWTTFFSMSIQESKKMARWVSLTLYFQTILPETFHGNFEEIKNLEQFEKLFDWYFSTKQVHQKRNELQLMKIIEDHLPDWIHLFRFEAPKDVKDITPSLRSKYQVWSICQRI